MTKLKALGGSRCAVIICVTAAGAAPADPAAIAAPDSTAQPTLRAMRWSTSIIGFIN
jgi:hypothetical protein